MEIGADNKNKLIWAGVLGLLAVLALGRLILSLWGSSPAAAAPPSPHITPAPAAAPRVTPKKNTRMQPSLDPTLRFDWLKLSEDTKYEGKGKNIFRAEAEPLPQPIAPPVVPQPAPQPVADPGPPPPPPINLKFYGFAAPRNGVKKIFLSDNNGDIFIAGEGDIVDRQYKILRIMPMAVEIEDVLNNNRQQIPLTQG